MKPQHVVTARAPAGDVLCACGGCGSLRLSEAHPCLRRLIAEYVQAAPRSAVAEAVETLAGPALLRMVHTRHGAGGLLRAGVWHRQGPQEGRQGHEGCQPRTAHAPPSQNQLAL